MGGKMPNVRQTLFHTAISRPFTGPTPACNNPALLILHNIKRSGLQQLRICLRHDLKCPQLLRRVTRSHQARICNLQKRRRFFRVIRTCGTDAEMISHAGSKKCGCGFTARMTELPTEARL